MLFLAPLCIPEISAAAAALLEVRVAVAATEAAQSHAHAGSYTASARPPRGARRRAEAEAAAAELRRADFRQKMLALATQVRTLARTRHKLLATDPHPHPLTPQSLTIVQLGTEAQRRSSSTAAGPGVGTGAGASADLAAMLGAIMPALAHALAPTAEIGLLGGAQAFGEERDRLLGAGGASGDAAAAAAAAASVPVPQRSSAAAVRTYRRLWLSLATLGLADGGVAVVSGGSGGGVGVGGGGAGAGGGHAGERRWPPACLRAVRAVAVVSPVLVLRPASSGDGGASISSGTGASGSLLDLDLASGTSAGAGAGSGAFDDDGAVRAPAPAQGAGPWQLSPLAIADARAFLLAALPPRVRVRVAQLAPVHVVSGARHASCVASHGTQQSLTPAVDFSALPVRAQAFMRAALALETQRAACGVCKAPFLYLLDATLEAEGLGPLIECLAEVALERLLRFALRLGRGAARDALLRDHALCFLAYCAHRFTRVRRFAFRSLVSHACAQTTRPLTHSAAPAPHHACAHFSPHPPTATGGARGAFPSGKESRSSDKRARAQLKLESRGLDATQNEFVVPSF